MVWSFCFVLWAILCCSLAGTLCNGSFKVELLALFRGRSASCWQNGRRLPMFQEAVRELSEPCRDYVQIQCCPRGFDGCPQMAPKVCVHGHGIAGCHELCGHRHAWYWYPEELAQVDGAPRHQFSVTSGIPASVAGLKR